MIVKIKSGYILFKEKKTNTLNNVKGQHISYLITNNFLSYIFIHKYNKLNIFYVNLVNNINTMEN